MCLIVNTELFCMKCGGIEPHFLEREMSHGISRVVAGTWGIFSSYSRDGHSKLHFVKQSQDSFLVTTNTSGIYTGLGRTIQMLPEVRWETKLPFIVSTEILGLLSIFKKSQTFSPSESLNSEGLSRFQVM